MTGPAWGSKLDRMARPPAPAPKIAVVIGAGTVGLRAALKLAVRGMRVSVLERHSVPLGSTPAIHSTLLSFPDVRVAGGVDVVDMWVLPNRRAVRGVRAHLRDLQHAEFFADLVVDATGSTSTFASWRGTPGYTRVEDLDAALDEKRELSVAR